MFGIILNSIGPALPFIIADLNLTMTEAGTLYSLRGLGIVIAVLLSGVLADRIGVRWIILSGSFFWVSGFFIFATATTAFAALSLWLIIGLGLGAIDIGLNTLVAQLNQEKGKALNRLHFWFGIGAIIGPLWAQLLLTLSSWRVLATSTGLLALIFFLYMFFQQFPKTSQKERKDQPKLVHIWSIPLLMLAFMMLGYTGVGTSFMGWMNTYLIQSLGTSTWRASFILALYSSGLAVGRLITSFIVERLRYDRLLLISSVLSLGSTILALFTSSPFLAGTGFFLTGVFFSGLLPTSLAIGAKLHPDQTGTVTGVLVTFGAIGRTILPGMVGATADIWGITSGMRTLVLVVVFMVGASSVLLSRRKVATSSTDEE